MCEHEWLVIPNSIIQGYGCPKCKNKRTGDRCRKTHDSFINELAKVNKFIMVLGNYETTDKKLLCECLICGHQWMASPNKLLNRRSCPKCAIIKRNNSKIIGFNKILDELAVANANVDVIGEYSKKSVPILCKCRACGHEWRPMLGNLIENRSGCPECARIRSMKTNDEFLIQLNSITRIISPMELYQGVEHKIKVKCLREECNNIWKTTPHSLLKGSGCPKCNSSYGELRVLDYLQNNKIDYVWQKTYDGLLGLGNGLLSYDFYLPDYNLLIEYQGEFHDGTAKQMKKDDFKYRQEHDYRKREYAKLNKINLLEIWYWDFNNIENILFEKLLL